MGKMKLVVCPRSGMPYSVNESDTSSAPAKKGKGKGSKERCPACGAPAPKDGETLATWE